MKMNKSNTKAIMNKKMLILAMVFSIALTMTQLKANQKRNISLKTQSSLMELEGLINLAQQAFSGWGHSGKNKTNNTGWKKFSHSSKPSSSRKPAFSWGRSPQSKSQQPQNTNINTFRDEQKIRQRLKNKSKFENKAKKQYRAFTGTQNPQKVRSHKWINYQPQQKPYSVHTLTKKDKDGSLVTTETQTYSTTTSTTETNNSKSIAKKAKPKSKSKKTNSKSKSKSSKVDLNQKPVETLKKSKDGWSESIASDDAVDSGNTSKNAKSDNWDLSYSGTGWDNFKI